MRNFFFTMVLHWQQIGTTTRQDRVLIKREQSSWHYFFCSSPTGSRLLGTKAISSLGPSLLEPHPPILPLENWFGIVQSEQRECTETNRTFRARVLIILIYWTVDRHGEQKAQKERFKQSWLCNEKEDIRFKNRRVLQVYKLSWACIARHENLGRFLHIFLSFFLATRAVLVFALLGLFLVFFGRSVERYQKGRIATDQVYRKDLKRKSPLSLPPQCFNLREMWTNGSSISPPLRSAPPKWNRS